MKPYNNVLNRAKVLTKNLETIIEKNRELSAANQKLRKAQATDGARYAAELRVIRKEIEEQVRNENKRTADEVQA